MNSYYGKKRPEKHSLHNVNVKVWTSLSMQQFDKEAIIYRNKRKCILIL